MYSAMDNTNFSNNPEDYYFMINDDCEDDLFSITPKSYYDKYNCLLDSSLGIDGQLWDNGFMGLCDSTYEYQNGTVEDGRQVLLNLGLTEKKMHY
jgi:hypothetical protein